MQSQIFAPNQVSGATFSEDRKYRYALWRIWNESQPLVMFIGLNPSKANETAQDNTITKVIKIAKYNGFGGLYMMNCFPIVSTDPSILKEFEESDSLEDIENMRWLLDVRRKCKEVVFAWGNFKEAMHRGEAIRGYFKNGKALHKNKNGSPKHPLFCKDQTEFINF